MAKELPRSPDEPTQPHTESTDVLGRVLKRFLEPDESAVEPPTRVGSRILRELGDEASDHAANELGEWIELLLSSSSSTRFPEGWEAEAALALRTLSAENVLKRVPADIVIYVCAAIVDRCRTGEGQEALQAALHLLGSVRGTDQNLEYIRGVNQGKALIHLYTHTGNMLYINRAVDAYEDLLNSIEQEDLSAELLSDASVAYIKRFRAIGATTDLYSAATLSDEAVARASHTDRAYMLINRGVAYKALGEFTEEDEYLDVARESYVEALAIDGLSESERQSCIQNLLNLSEEPPDAALLHELERAIANERDPFIAIRRANALIAAIVKFGDEALLFEAFEFALLQACRIDSGGPSTAGLLANIGALAADLDKEADDDELRDLSKIAFIAAYELCGENTLDLYDITLLWATKTRRPTMKQSHAAALSRMADVVVKIFLAQHNEDSRLDWWRLLGSVASEVATALVQSGESRRAIDVVEQLKATSISQRVYLKGRMRHVTVEPDAAVLQERFERAFRLSDSYLHPARDSDVAQSQRALSEGFGRTDGYLPLTSLLPTSSVTQWQELLPRRSSVVYLPLASHGAGSALAVQSGHDVQTVPIAALKYDEVRKHAESYFRSYYGRQRDFLTWLKTFNETCHWIGQEVIGPVLQGLPDIDHLVVVPFGPLTFLPLHAAYVINQGDRHHFADDVVITYSPNGQLTVSSTEEAPKLDSSNGVVVSGDSPDGWRPLRYASTEAASVVKNWPHWEELLAASNDTEVLISALERASSAHLICHGLDAVGEPDDMSYIFFGGRHIRCHDLARHSFENLQVAVLAACDTSLPGVHATDQAWGFPGIFLGCGARAVVSAMWAADDGASAAIMSTMHRYCSSRSLPVHTALRLAQMDIRRGIADEEALASLPRNLLSRIRNGRYADAIYWAPFVYHGEI